MNDKPLVSVMITSYNQRDQLIRAIDSVLNQSYEHIQVVISDDFSTKDDSREVIADYHKKYGEKVKPIFQKQNVGIPKNKNTGFKACDGDYITYCDGDDFYYPEKIDREVKTFLENPWADIVYSNFAFTDLQGKHIKKWAEKNQKLPTGNVFKEVYTREFPYTTVYRCELMKRSTLQSIDYYDERIRAFHDWDSRIRMTKNAKVAYSDYVASAYVDDPAGISKSEKLARLHEEMLFVYDKNKHLLDNEKKEISNYITKQLDYFFSMKKFSAYPEKRVVSEIFNHVKTYPKDLFSKKTWAYLFLNENMIESIKKRLK